MYKLVAIAGTFDRLHKGHRYFIFEAFKKGHKVIIGLTSDSFVNSKFKNQRAKLQLKAQNYQERKNELEVFLKEKGYLERTTIVKIDDVYGPAVRREEEIEALVVTKETLGGGRLVNKKRKDLKLTPLKLVTIPLIPAQDRRRISSTRIRLGEIDRWGKRFKLKVQNSKLPPSPRLRRASKTQISNELRNELKKPLGILVKGNVHNHHLVVSKLKEIVAVSQTTMIITVGDEVTKLCNEIGLVVHLAIFDYRVGREKKYASLGDLDFPQTLTRVSPFVKQITVRNPAGHISQALVNAVRKSIKETVRTGNQRLIRVIGEEDLAGVPAILLAPLDSIVLYGQPGEGVVVVYVTEEKKEELLKMIKRYRQNHAIA